MSWKIFYSYSHKDASIRERLSAHLAPLRQNKKLVDWYDRKIEPGANWKNRIESEIDSANLIILLLSSDFFASDYCIGMEVYRALERLKKGEVKIVTVLLAPCLWGESPISELQMLPRDAKPITSRSSPEEALNEVAVEISKIVSAAPPAPRDTLHERDSEVVRLGDSIALVRQQIQAYSRIYESIRYRLTPSKERTGQMEVIFKKMRDLATASYPLLRELANSPSPGDRLAAVSILQVFASDAHLTFLTDLIASEKPFVGFHAIRALRFAVSSLDTHSNTNISEAIRISKESLQRAGVSVTSDRQVELNAAEQEFKLIAAPLVPIARETDAQPFVAPDSPTASR